MSCTCTCHRSSGHLINRRAFLGSQIVTLRARVKELEKLARRTPPKTLAAEWARVHAAKHDLDVTARWLFEAELELATLSPSEDK